MVTRYIPHVSVFWHSDRAADTLTQASLTTGGLASGSVVVMSCVMLTLSVDVTHKEVKRDTAGRRPGERERATHTIHCQRHTLPHCQRLLSWPEERFLLLKQPTGINRLKTGRGQGAAGHSRRGQGGNSEGAKRHNLSQRRDTRLTQAEMEV